MNLMPLLEDDLVEVCFKCLDGELRGMRFRERASVVIYAVPLDYGGHRRYSGPRRVRLEEAEELKRKYGEDLRLYPGSLEVRETGELWALGSRTVAAVGLAEDLEGARGIALEAVRRIDGPLRHREDIALREHVERSVSRLRALRSSAP
jgi:phosphoribosylamine--glycine ligase